MPRIEYSWETLETLKLVRDRLAKVATEVDHLTRGLELHDVTELKVGGIRTTHRSLETIDNFAIALDRIYHELMRELAKNTEPELVSVRRTPPEKNIDKTAKKRAPRKGAKDT